MYLVTEYIRQFGLSKTALVFHYFKYLSLFEQGRIDKLPEDVTEAGLNSTAELISQLQSIKRLVYNTEPIIDVSKFTPFEIQMLSLITGKSIHRFDAGKPSMERIVQDFREDADRITPLPAEYTPEVIEASNIEIKFNSEAIWDDYNILKDEILDSLQNPKEINSIKNQLISVLQAKINQINDTLQTADGKRLEFIEKEKDKYQHYSSRIEETSDVDSLMSTLMDLIFDKTEKKAADSALRKLTFRKLFQRHYSPGFLYDLRSQLEGELTPQSLLSVVNVVDHMVKAHVLNLQSQNQEKYWEDETFEKMRQSKRGRSLGEIFSPYASNLRAEIDQFQVLQKGSSRPVWIIPDRGFVGEMAGYLANVCYTSEYPLLLKWPKLIPYKFVQPNPDTGEPEFIGSVLVFEVEATDGKGALLVRAFDVPNETSINIQVFIEQFLDKMASVAEKRGKSKVLVPGSAGSISNYQMTIAHISNTYVKDQQAVSLNEPFSFNNCDLTKSCYVARELET